MRVCTIYVPNIYSDCVDILVNMGFYPSRSEAVRHALKRFLMKEAEFAEKIDSKTFKNLILKQMEAQEK